MNRDSQVIFGETRKIAGVEYQLYQVFSNLSLNKEERIKELKRELKSQGCKVRVLRNKKYSHEPTAVYFLSNQSA